MIGVRFLRGAEDISVVLNGIDVYIRDNNSFVSAPLSNLKFSYEGVIKEFPDLKDDSEWREKAINRFFEKLDSFKTEDERVNYIIQDLRNHNYIPISKQRAGFRTQKLS